jgi:RNA polymerase sigma-70 factor (ECF subfamily)
MSRSTIDTVNPVSLGALDTLEALFREHYQSLCIAAYYILGEEEAAKDVVQDFFFYCWKKRNELVIVKDFKHYASRAIKNASLNYLKYARRTSLSPDLMFEGMSDPVQSPGEDRDGEAARNQALWTAIGQLPEQRRLIFLLSNKDGLTYVQIAKRLNISVNTVKTQIRLAYQYLRIECRWLLNWLLIVLFFKK